MTVEHFGNDACRRGTEIEEVRRQLTAIRAEMVADPATPQRRLEGVHTTYRDSARNLLHYLALRRHDLRPLQLRLAALGLSSLRRAESHVLATVDAVLEVLHHLAGRPWQPPSQEQGIVDFINGQRLLAEHTEALLGPAPSRSLTSPTAGAGRKRPRRLTSSLAPSCVTSAGLPRGRTARPASAAAAV